MPALMTWGGVALAVLGLVIAIAGLPDRAAGLSMGSDLLQAGASIFAGGLIVAALGQVLRGLREVADRVEEAGFGLSPSRRSFNDDDQAEEAPMPLPRAAPRTVPNPAADTHEPELPEAEPRAAARDPLMRAPRTREPQADARAPRTQQQAQARTMQPEEEFGDEAAAERREPRWLRTQASAQQDAPPVAPPQRPTRGPAAAPENRMRREAPPQYEAIPRRRALQPEALPAEEEAVASVVRSGIIGGMAYTLYSDGSIEAELPIGTVRFNSLAELQEHVKRAGAEADGDFRGPKVAPH